MTDITISNKINQILDPSIFLSTNFTTVADRHSRDSPEYGRFDGVSDIK